MAASSEFYSIKAPATSELTVKGSKFIGHAAPAASEDAARDFVSKISGRFQDATHNCFAYKIGTGDKAVFRFSDAGEPSGTAGRPILQAIETKNLTNVAVVVTRYFGGTKLGTGGLIRAYSASALAALGEAGIVKGFLQAKLRLAFDYSFANSVHQLVQKYDATILATRYEDASIYVIQIKAADEPAFTADLRDQTKGKLSVERVE